MNDSKLMPAKLFISILVPLIIVTFGGIFVYHTASDFFYPAADGASAETNGPAVIYYALTLVISLMYFFMRQKYKWYEVIAFTAISIVYSFSLQHMTPGISRPLYLYFLPLMLFFIGMWLIVKYIFLNKRVRPVRLLLFSLSSAAAFSLAFRFQYAMLKQPVDKAFLGSRFVSGLMLFILVGLGLTLAEFAILRMEEKQLKIKPDKTDKPTENNPEENDKTD